MADRKLLLLICLAIVAPGCQSELREPPPVASSAPAADSSPAFDTDLPLFSVIDFGATGDGVTLETDALQRAIDAAARAGGGTVYFPAGNYRSGTLQLKENLSLYLGPGSTLSGSTDLKDYHPEKTHLLYAEDADHISICGPGVIDGNGPRFWDNGRLEKWLKGEIELSRTKEMIRFDRCSHIRLDQVQVRDGAFWNIAMGHCREIVIDGIRIRTGVYEDDGPNTDGINLWHCQRVAISNCDIVTGDDCIVVLGESRDVTITNCQLQTSETALMISGVENLTFSNSTIRDSGCGIGFRVWSEIVVDGVAIDNIVLSTSPRYQNGGTAIYLWSFPVYTETVIDDGQDLPPAGKIRNITISNMVATANGLVCVNGYPESPVEGLTLQNVRFTMFGGKQSEYNENPPYPYPIYGFHNASPYGMFFRYVDDLALRQVRVQWNEPERAEWGSALRCWQVNDLEITGFFGRHAAGSQQPTVSLKQVDRASIRDCRAEQGTGTFLELREGTRNVSLWGNDLSAAERPMDNQTEAAVFSDQNRLPEK
ncbi:MAG: glycosyl hydrolase family 28 protein [Mariniblastus sp.]|nr:glycosyl hydrolase family 28 protein [Mariniblastus sp.]